MKILQMHADFIEYTPVKKEIKAAEEVEPKTVREDDIVDGAVAKATGKASKRGAFLDSPLDRVAEIALFAGVLIGGYSSPPVVLLALSLSLLVSYTRAKGDALGVSLSGVGVGERSERLLIIAVSSVIGLLWLGVVLVLAVALYTFLERTFRAIRALK